MFVWTSIDCKWTLTQSTQHHEPTSSVKCSTSDCSTSFTHTPILSLPGVNKCPEGSRCSKWTDIYPTPKSMCEQIWSNSYLYTSHTKTSGRCMQLWFMGPNPNKKVAAYYLNNGQQHQSTSPPLAFLVVASFYAILFHPWPLQYHLGESIKHDLKWCFISPAFFSSFELFSLLTDWFAVWPKTKLNYIMYCVYNLQTFVL